MHKTEGENHDGNEFTNGPPGTKLEKNWANAVQNEIVNVVEGAGLTLKTASTETGDQLLAAINALIESSMPSGSIVLWSGAISAIPSGWYLCDGTNSTPDLTDRFVIHADADAAGTNDVGDTGGSKTISEANLPAHTHAAGTLATASDGAHTHSQDTTLDAEAGASRRSAQEAGTPYSNINSDGAHTHTISGSTGSIGSGTDYMQKYYALAYIMKSL